MGTVELRGAHADPRIMSGQVVPAVLAGNETCLGLLVQQVQPLVAAVEVDQPRLMNRGAAHPFEEIERVGNRSDDTLIRVLQRRVLDETQVPVLWMVQVGETA